MPFHAVPLPDAATSGVAHVRVRVTLYRGRMLMRSHVFGHRVAALLVVSGVTCAALASAPASVASSSASKVYIAAKGCTGSSYKPTSVVFACADGNLYATKLKYSTYGSREASATGTIHLNACTPNCAQGKFQTKPGSVRFTKVVRCKDRRSYFASAKYKFGKRSGTADIEPFKCK